MYMQLDMLILLSAYAGNFRIRGIECPRDWIPHQEGSQCLRRLDDMLTFYDARAKCMSLKPGDANVDVVAIPDVHTQRFILSRLIHRSGSFKKIYWTGLYFSSDLNAFEWSNTHERLGEYNNWAIGHGKRIDSKSAVYLDGDTGLWHQASGFAMAFPISTDRCKDGHNGGCQQGCTSDAYGHVLCICEKGYRKISRFSCKDIDECLLDNGGCDHQCSNSEGEFNCDCRDGFHKNETNCADIDECSSDNGGCQYNCSNIAGSFVCYCMDGYKLENLKCITTVPKHPNKTNSVLVFGVIFMIVLIAVTVCYAILYQGRNKKENILDSKLVANPKQVVSLKKDVVVKSNDAGQAHDNHAKDNDTGVNKKKEQLDSKPAAQQHGETKKTVDDYDVNGDNEIDDYDDDDDKDDKDDNDDQDEDGSVQSDETVDVERLLDWPV